VRKVIALTLFLVVSGCGEPDPNYETLKQLDGSARLDQFKTFPINERLRLYNKVYRKSGHPHDSELSIGFRDNPDETLRRIIVDLRTSGFGDFMRYFHIIYDIGMHSRLDICRQEYIGSLKSILASYKLSAGQAKALEEVRFSRCQLP
jgi:hypothetical protein